MVSRPVKKKISPRRILLEKLLKKTCQSEGSVKKIIKKTATKKIKIATKKLINPIGNAPLWFLDVPFEWRPAMSSLGVRYDSHYKQYVWRGEILPDNLLSFKAHPLSWIWHQQNIANGYQLNPLTITEPRFLMRDHQEIAVDGLIKAYKAKSPGFVLADEVGVGKTMTAWSFALKTPSLQKILIVTTASAQAHWRNTIRHAGWLPNQNITIINYDRLGKLFEEPEQGLTSDRAKGKRKRLAKQGVAPSYDLVIFDESHKGKNPTSARGLMMRKIEMSANFCIFASATAGQNPIELVYLAPILSFASKTKIKSDTLEDFSKWCAANGLGVTRGAFGKIIWDYNEADLSTIKKWLFEGETPLGIRRLPEDIRGWPALSRQLLPFELDFQASKTYATIWNDFVSQEMKNSSIASKKDQSSAREKNRMRLRQESSWLRIPNTVILTNDLIEQNKKVAISVAFRATMEKMIIALEETGLIVAQIHGQQNVNEKEQQRLMFQNGNAQVIVFTVEEAISLHQGEYAKDQYPRILLIHDIRWSAIQMSQIEGRCHRDGMLAPVMWMVADNTIDLDIAKVMIDKVKGMKALHGDKVGDMDAIENVLNACLSNSYVS